MPRGVYSTRFKMPKYTTEKRITIPQPPTRPLQFQARGLIRRELLRKDPWWFTFHRRGVKRMMVGTDTLEDRAVPHSLVRGTLPERIVYRSLMEFMHMIPGVDFDFQCVGAYHRILTSDMRWVNAGELKPGDKILSFDEEGNPSRSWTEGTVVSNKVEDMDAYLVRLSDGRGIVTTAEHPWLVHYSPEKHDWGKNTGYSWVNTEDLKVGAYIPVFFDTWEPDNSYESGWLAGFFDGEGSVIHGKTQTGGHALSLSIGQNTGSMFDTFVKYTKELGFDISIYDYRGKYERSYDDGKREVIQLSESLKFLGTVRPAKLDCLDLEKLGKLTKIRQVQVEEVVHLKNKHPIARIGVDKHTYVAEGFGMHNTSLQGGRIDLGGIVADFIFPILRIVIQVQGPTHKEYLRVQKDREQTMALEAMGYDVYAIWEDTIYDEYALEDWMRKVFGWNHSGGGFQGDSLGDYKGQLNDASDVSDNALMTTAMSLANSALSAILTLGSNI